MCHICLLAHTDQPALFSGDTLFNAGAGNCHNGGHPDELYETFDQQLSKLRDDTLVYPGHDYLVNNLRFHYTVRTRVIREIEFMLSLNNIFNEEYEANAWVYRYYTGGQEYEMNGYFPQAKFHLFGGISLRF